MSSRALRKLQKQREQEAQLATVQSEEKEDSSNDERIQPKPKVNAFDLLNASEEVNDEPQSDDDADVEDRTPVVTDPSESATPPISSTAGRKKKKKKKKKSIKPPDDVAPGLHPSENAELDEIDKALRELSASKPPAESGLVAEEQPSDRDLRFAEATSKLLSIDPKSLNATNEMRRLFGNVVLESFDQPEQGATNRRRDRDRRMLDLGRALTGRYSPASKGQSLAGVTLRRNILMQGKDEWPRTPSGGLGMELVEKQATGNIKYKIVHNTAYNDVQNQFNLCVESMDPQRLIHLLQYNPYHISTLLQVSEIAKHQGDHAVSADLLERALFNIGRSAHSSFGNQLKEGRARLDFLYMENRELWLVIWRYIGNLVMKGTLRTAYEWAKLLLSLDTNDPYCMRLLIDNLALRGRQYGHFIELCTETIFHDEWKDLPNIQCSLALALFRQNKPAEARDRLRKAMFRFPWIFSKLAQELDIQPIPKRIWGKMPPTQSQELLTALYINRSKDLWNTPEVISLLVEVADTLPDGEEALEPIEITLDIARHVILSDLPTVTTHLPTRFTAGRISASDPLPPYESEAYRQQSEPSQPFVSQAPGPQAQGNWFQALMEQIRDINENRANIAHANGIPGDFLDQEFSDDELDDNDDDNIDNHIPNLELPPDSEDHRLDQQPLAYHHDDHAHQQPPPPSPLESDNTVPSPPPPPTREAIRSNPELLQRWLLGSGLQQLKDFLHQHGIDPGNWGDVVGFSPLTRYVETLALVRNDAARQRLLRGPIRGEVGDMAVELLEDELQMLLGEEDGR